MRQCVRWCCIFFQARCKGVAFKYGDTEVVSEVDLTAGVDFPAPQFDGSAGIDCIFFV